ncbi:hypothetical protein SOVF_066700 [Spinacia oleracea]|uniref:Uncharacterized protein n=1 Tax=Spinacia oleracea TaxID=3562 RepID=A0A9R0ICK5_SPIOL|nr:uncharacterized protein LOC110786434 [Spinacia oleracea]KNA18869.1 hypothetical protein SOVF_066700 [Spinacia oleracea]
MAYQGNNYYEREVIRDSPCDSYSEYSRVEGGYGRPAGYPIGHQLPHHHNHNNVVTDVVYETSTIPRYGHHHHHHGGAEVVQRQEERIVYENDFDPCRRMY